MKMNNQSCSSKNDCASWCEPKTAQRMHAHSCSMSQLHKRNATQGRPCHTMPPALAAQWPRPLAEQCAVVAASPA